MATLSASGFSKPLELVEALKLAQKTNPELAALLDRTAAARARVDAADALPDPKAQFTYFGESVETRTGPQEAIYSISQTIPWLSKLSTRVALANHKAEAIAALYQEAQLRINEALTQTFTEVVYYREAIRTTTANLEWLLESQPIIEERVRAGESINALLRLEVEAERLRDRLEQYEQAHHTQRARLAALIGIPEDELSSLGSLPELDKTTPDHPSLQKSLLHKNPTLQTLQSRTQSASAQADLSRLERYPDITVGLNYIQVGDNGAPVSDAGRDPWNITVAVNLPVWEGRNRSEIRASLAERRASESLYRSHLLDLQAELSASLTRKSTNLRRMARHRETLIPLAKQALDNSHAAYRSGQISILELIDSERALLELELNYLRANADALQDEATIRRLTNTPVH